MDDSADNSIERFSSEQIVKSAALSSEHRQDEYLCHNPVVQCYKRSLVGVKTDKLHHCDCCNIVENRVLHGELLLKTRRIGLKSTRNIQKEGVARNTLISQSLGYQENQPLSGMTDSVKFSSINTILNLSKTDDSCKSIKFEKSSRKGTNRTVDKNYSMPLTGIAHSRGYAKMNGYAVGFRTLSGSGIGLLIVYVMILLTILQYFPHSADAISLAPVSWNTSNPIFKTSRNDHIIDVKLYDDIDFICPYYSPGGQHHIRHQQHHEEHYVVYMVSKVEYDDCNIYSEASALMVLNCSNPRQRKRFTILFEPFQSIPNVPEYKANGTYYFMTTSTGKPEGLGNLYQGACRKYNMKLMIKICCSPNAGTGRPADKRVTGPPGVSKDLDMDKPLTGHKTNGQVLDWEKDRNRVAADQSASTTLSVSLEDDDRRFGVTTRDRSEKLFDKWIFSSKSDDNIKPSKRDSMLDSSQLGQQQQQQRLWQMHSSARSIYRFTPTGYSLSTSLSFCSNLLTILVSRKLVLYILCDR